VSITRTQAKVIVSKYASFTSLSPNNLKEAEKELADLKIPDSEIEIYVEYIYEIQGKNMALIESNAQIQRLEESLVKASPKTYYGPDNSKNVGRDSIASALGDGSGVDSGNVNSPP